MTGAPGRLALVVGLAFLAIVLILPVAGTIAPAWAGAIRGGTLAATLGDPVTTRALENSVVQGSLGTAGAIALGLPAGIALGRGRVPGRPVFEGLLLVAFLAPNLVMVDGVVALFGRSPAPFDALGGGLGGVVAVDALYNAPIVALLTSLGAGAADARLEEAVRVLGGGAVEAFRRVWGPPAMAGAAAAAALTFALSALAFAAPIAIGGASNYTLEARIWSLDQQLVEPGAAAVVAGLGLLVLVIPAAVYVVLWRRLRPGGSSMGGRAPAAAGRGAGRWVALGVLLALTALELAVLASAVGRLGSPGTPAAGSGPAVSNLFRSGVAARLGISTFGALANSGFFAATATLLALLVGLALVYGLRSVPPRSAGLLVGLPFLSILVSPIVLALSLTTVYGAAIGGPEAVWSLILLSQSALALPFVAAGLFVAVGRLPPSLRESAQVLGASPGFAFRDIEVPAVRRGVAAAALLGLAVALGEFAATFFLAPPRYATATVELYRLADLRWVPEGWALGGLLALVTGVVLVAAAIGGARVGR